jgi:Bacterial SH3 domain
MMIIYYLWSLVADTFLFLRGLIYKVMGIPVMRVDILAWLFIVGYTVFEIWWPPLTGQSKWTPLSGAICAASFLGVTLTFKLLFNRNHLFRKGWSESLTKKGKSPLANQPDSIRVELVVGSGESSTRYLAVTNSSLFLTLEYDRNLGVEFPFNETHVEMGMLYRYCRIRPALRLTCKSLGKASAYVFKAEPAVLFGLFGLITSNQQTTPVKSTGTRTLASVSLAVGMLIAFTFGLWRITTITHPEPVYPIGVINSPEAALYELPASKSRLVSSLKPGEQVIVIEGTKDWFYVQNSGKQAGYVPKGFVNLPK